MFIDILLVHFVQNISVRNITLLLCLQHHVQDVSQSSTRVRLIFTRSKQRSVTGYLDFFGTYKALNELWGQPPSIDQPIPAHLTVGREWSSVFFFGCCCRIQELNKMCNGLFTTYQSY